MDKWLKRTSWILSLLFVIVVALPLAAERLSLSRECKSLFASFQLKDGQGMQHNGYFAHGKYLGFYTEGLQYGYEQPKGKDLGLWRKTIPKERKYPHSKEGFYWSDKGFLWAGVGTKERSKEIFREGKHLNQIIPLSDQTEMVLPGAPLDSWSPTLSLFGRFPEYQVTYDDEYFRFDLLYKARTSGWYLWNGGKPFRTGDFGLGSMNELACHLEGTIIHKKSGKRFQVAGTGLFEDAMGMPWSWFEWGPHDWMDLHFQNGWSGALWKANDDWQWGYHPYPELGWIYDPQKDKFYIFHRVEILDKELVVDDLNRGFDYPRRSHWRAIAAEGTLEIFAENVSYGPVLTQIAHVPRKARLSYGTNSFKGRFIRRDGSTVELEGGVGTMEHFMPFFPDFRLIAPIMLILVILSWGASGISIRVKEGRPWRRPLVMTAVSLLVVLCIYCTWSA